MVGIDLATSCWTWSTRTTGWSAGDQAGGAGPRLLHRFSSILCLDSAGRLYVHRRTDDKDVYPGMYDTAAGGVLAAGETYLEAARRELAEELGVAGPEPRFLFRHRYRGPENPSWSALFEVTWDGPVRPQASEIAWGAFLTMEELDARLQEWPFVPDGRRSSAAGGPRPGLLLARSDAEIELQGQPACRPQAVSR